MAYTLLPQKLGVLSLSLLQLLSVVQSLTARQPPDNIVMINASDSYCMIMPRNPHTNIGDSETPGGMQTFCSQAARTSGQQGLLPSNFWSNVELQIGISSSGARFVQLTGCIRSARLDRLNPGDGGGQYDSSGGDGGQGNPAGSSCTGYSHYVELVEPANNRACIKCCNNFNDCPLDRDTSGCPAVIQGNYFDCN